MNGICSGNYQESIVLCMNVINRGDVFRKLILDYNNVELVISMKNMSDDYCVF